MKTRLLLPFFLVVLLPVLGATFLLHTPAAQAQDASLNQARDAFDAGQDLFQQEKFLEAAVKFKEAYDARPFAQFLFNIGACYEKSNQYQDAIGYYERYIAAKPSDDDIAKTEQRITALKKAIEEIGVSGADPAQPTEAMKNLEQIEIRGLVVIESEPQGADIYLDSRTSKPLSKTPWNGTLTGEHLVIIERKGYKPVERTIRPDPNKLLVLVFGLGEQDYLGYLDVTSNIPGAEIYIDDKSVGAKARTPWSGEIQPGKHKIWVTKDGYTEYETEVEVVAGETHKVSATIDGAEVGLLNVRGKGVEKVKVYVDGTLRCKRGPCIEKLEAGTHKVSIRRSGYRSYNQTIEVQSKTEVTMRATLAKSPSRKDAVVAYLFAAAFAGGGYYLGTKSQELEDELARDIEAGNPPVDDNDPRLGFGLKTGKTYALAADVSYAMSGATFLLAVYYTFRDKGRASTGSHDIRAISFEPQLGPDYAGLGLARDF